LLLPIKHRNGDRSRERIAWAILPPPELERGNAKNAKDRKVRKSCADHRRVPRRRHQSTDHCWAMPCRPQAHSRYLRPFAFFAFPLAATASRTDLAGGADGEARRQPPVIGCILSSCSACIYVNLRKTLLSCQHRVASRTPGSRASAALAWQSATIGGPYPPESSPLDTEADRGPRRTLGSKVPRGHRAAPTPVFTVLSVRLRAETTMNHEAPAID